MLYSDLTKYRESQTSNPGSLMLCMRPTDFSIWPCRIASTGLSGLPLAPGLRNVTFAFENLTLEASLRKCSVSNFIFVYRDFFLITFFKSNVFD